MKNVTTMKINSSAKEIYKAITDKNQISNFWFLSSSNIWEVNKKITLTYDEYNYVGTITILELIEDKLIKFQSEDKRIIAIKIKEQKNDTILQVTEADFDENDANFIESILDNKEGWTFMLCCLKAYLEYNIKDLRSSLM